MNYEDFYKDAQVVEKNMKDKLQSLQKSFKGITKNSESGDYKNLLKEISQMHDTLTDLNQLCSEMQEAAQCFDTKEYFTEGDFARQMIDYCNQYSVDVKGDFPMYEMFPYKVRVDAENQDVYINRKKVQCVRPLRFVMDLKEKREKYVKAPFNITVFVNELVAAYDLAAKLKSMKNNNVIGEPDLSLKDLYEYMAPTQRARREYDLQNYAYDLARLYSSDVTKTRDGRVYDVGTTKISNKFIRILDTNGKEQLLGTIRFYKELSE